MTTPPCPECDPDVMSGIANALAAASSPDEIHNRRVSAVLDLDETRNPFKDHLTSGLTLPFRLRQSGVNFAMIPEITGCDVSNISAQTSWVMFCRIYSHATTTASRRERPFGRPSRLPHDPSS